MHPKATGTIFIKQNLWIQLRGNCLYAGLPKKRSQGFHRSGYEKIKKVTCTFARHVTSYIEGCVSQLNIDK